MIRLGEWYGFNCYDGGVSDMLIGGCGNDWIVCYVGNEDMIIFCFGDVCDVLCYLNVMLDGDFYGDELFIDCIVLIFFDLDMIVEEFLVVYVIDLGDWVILWFGVGSDVLVIWDVWIDDLVDVLIF